MKTKSFNEVIADYLKQRATEDALFTPKFTNSKKSVDECCQYILGEARKRGREVVMTDDEVFGLAVHYYDEENIVVNKSNGHKAKITQSSKPAKVIVSPVAIPKRGKIRNEENKLQLSLFD
ncbi:PcfK-like family protein [Parabacteroides faecis]|uniref:PcfK-like family protein n=1 Tax=Parabacteroides TaxID=375288 RepID=UPI000EFF89D6|nr:MULTISPECIES: Cas9 inhibitor AcrIIA9 family protein [Parabacteroides]MBC8618934.1 PcfK-like family protein [Parabacteroides faecis]RHS00057.1 hypothetical protein DWW23_05290 [Parabacteroides sp. AF14-59]